MKVLFVTQLMASQFHGPSRKAVLLAKFSKHSNDTVTDLRFLSEEPLADRPQDFTIIVPHKLRYSRLSKTFRAYFYYRRLVEIYKVWRFDLVCFNDAQKGWITLMFGLPRGLKFVAFINDDNSATLRRRNYDRISRYTYRLLQRLPEKYVAKNADQVICCSNYLAHYIRDAYTLRNLPQILPPAIEPEEWLDLPNKRESGTVLFVKSDPTRGGLDTLLSALHKNHLTNSVTHLHLGGFTAEHFNKDFAHLLPTDLNYTIHGHLSRPALRELVSQCEIGVVPSHFEAYGITAVEYLTGGLKTIVSDAGGLPEAVAGSHALLFAAGDSQDLADKLSFILNTPEYPTSYQPYYTSKDLYKKFCEIVNEISVSS
jgi:glycosyltransferase involved in cell wall biosynthesis